MSVEDVRIFVKGDFEEDARVDLYINIKYRVTMDKRLETLRKLFFEANKNVILI